MGFIVHLRCFPRADLEKSRAECTEHRATIAQQAQQIEDGKTALLTLEQQMTQAIAQLQVDVRHPFL